LAISANKLFSSCLKLCKKLTVYSQHDLIGSRQTIVRRVRVTYYLSPLTCRCTIWYERAARTTAAHRQRNSIAMYLKHTGLVENSGHLSGLILRRSTRVVSEPTADPAEFVAIRCYGVTFISCRCCLASASTPPCLSPRSAAAALLPTQSFYSRSTSRRTALRRRVTGRHTFAKRRRCVFLRRSRRRK